MRKLLLAIFFLSFTILSYAPDLKIRKEEQNITFNNSITRITEIINKLPIKGDLRHIPILSPLDTLTLKKVNSVFGNRVHPKLGVVRHHDGIDLYAKEGTKVLATASGYIEEVTYSNYGYGNCIVINHANGYKTRYAHLANIYVNQMSWINQGDLIAISGNTGLTTGPHLHYEILLNGKPINPVTIISNDASNYIASLKEIQGLMSLYTSLIM